MRQTHHPSQVFSSDPMASASCPPFTSATNSTSMNKLNFRKEQQIHIRRRSTQDLSLNYATHYKTSLMKTNNPSYDKLNLAINLEVGLFGNKLSHNKKIWVCQRTSLCSQNLKNTRGDLKYGLNWNLGYSFGCFSWPLSLFEVVADVGDEGERLGAEPKGGSEVLTGAICGV